MAKELLILRYLDVTTHPSQKRTDLSTSIKVSVDGDIKLIEFCIEDSLIGSLGL